MAKIKVIGRYKGFVMGPDWSFSNPVIMLAANTLVFKVRLKLKNTFELHFLNWQSGVTRMLLENLENNHG